MTEERISSPAQEDDDLAAYLERYTPEERDELRLASLAHDIVFLREFARRENGSRASVTIAIPWHDLGVERLAHYLTELGERVRVTEQILDTGRYLHIAPLRRQGSGSGLSALTVLCGLRIATRDREGSVAFRGVHREHVLRYPQPRGDRF